MMDHFSKTEVYELETYFQDEIPASVFVDDATPGYVTLFCLCDCGVIFAKATASTNCKTIISGYDRAFRSIKRQAGDHAKCLKCRNSEAPRAEFHHIRHASQSYGGHASKHQHSSIGIG